MRTHAREVAVRPGNPLYCAYLLGAAAGRGRIRYRVSAFPDFAIAGRLALILPGGVRLYVDADDRPDLDEVALEWCHAYGMVNLDRERSAGPHHNKLVALGPTFAARPWSPIGTLLHGARAVRADSGLSKHGRRMVLGRYRRLQAQRQRVQAYEPQVSDERYVFFVSRRWGNEAQGLDARRTEFIEAVRRHPAASFEGGLVGDDAAEDDGVITRRYRPKEYLARTRRSAVVFNTPAVHGCHGWKLGEYLALGKAIITTSLTRELPAPLQHGVHVHYVDDAPRSVDEAIDRVLTDLPYRRRLEAGARAYWEEWLEPHAMLDRLIQHAGA